MDFSSYFPIWNKLTPTQQQILERNAVLRKVDKGTVIHNTTVECTGLLLEECSLEETNNLKITHETIAGHRGDL